MKRIQVLLVTITLLVVLLAATHLVNADKDRAAGSTVGVIDAPAAPAALDAGRLPWQCGVSFKVFQGPGGSYSHTGSDRWAWDFGETGQSFWPVIAARNGIVAHVTTSYPSDNGCTTPACYNIGNRVVVDHQDGTAGLYLHLAHENPPSLRPGDLVTAGLTRIGLADHTGYSSNPHLHYAIQEWNSAWNDSSVWYKPSLESLFSDPNVPDGNPVWPNYYTSGNCVGDFNPALDLNLGSSHATRRFEIALGHPGPHGQTMPVAFYSDNLYADGNGRLFVPLDNPFFNVTPGIYDLYVKPQGYVRSKIPNIAVTGGTSYHDIASLLCDRCGGDSNNHPMGDNRVNGIDYAVMFYNWDPLRSESTPEVESPADLRPADLNLDGAVNGIDYAILYYGWGAVGVPLPGQGSPVAGSYNPESLVGEIALVPEPVAGRPDAHVAEVGDTVTLALDYDTASELMSGVGAQLTYDPCTLQPLYDQIIDTGVLPNTIATSGGPGSLLYDMLKWEDMGEPAPGVSGSGTLAYLPFQVIAGSYEASRITLQHLPGDTTDSNMTRDGTEEEMLGNVINTELLLGGAVRPSRTAQLQGLSPGSSLQNTLELAATASDPCNGSDVSQVSFYMLTDQPAEEATVSTLAGFPTQSGADDGFAAHSRFDWPFGVAVSADGTFALVADTMNHTIRRINLETKEVTTIAGQAGVSGSQDGQGANARFYQPYDVAISADGAFALVSDNFNHTIRRLDLATNMVSTVAGLAGVWGSADGTGATARFNRPAGVTITGDGAIAYVADQLNHTIRRIDLSAQAVTTVAGLAGNAGSQDGTGDSARFSNPDGISVSPSSQFLLVADSFNHTIRHVALPSAVVTTIAGSAGVPGAQDGVGAEARLASPFGIEIGFDGRYALIADTGNFAIRALNIDTRQVSTIAGALDESGSQSGRGDQARFNTPWGIALSTESGIALVADTLDNAVKEVSLWNFLGMDDYGADGWTFLGTANAYEDQIVKVKAHAGDNAGNGNDSPVVEGVYLDRIWPDVNSLRLVPSRATPGTQVQISVNAFDNLSGVSSIAVYADPSTLQSSPWSEWIHIGTINGSSGSLQWDTTGLSVGGHQIVLVVRDNANNEVYWPWFHDQTILFYAGSDFIFLPAARR